MTKNNLKVAETKEKQVKLFLKNHKKIICLVAVMCMILIVWLAGRNTGNTYIGTLNAESDKNVSVYAVDYIIDDSAVILRAEEYNQKSSVNTTYFQNIDDMGNAAVVTDEKGKVVWNFNINNPDDYYIVVKYYTVLGENTDIERNIYIDDSRLTSQAVSFKRNYSTVGEKKYDVQGNEIRQSEEENICWQEMLVRDNSEYSEELCHIRLEKGMHTIVVESVSNGMAIGSISLISNVKTPDTYDKYEECEDTDIKNLNIKIQAEDYTKKSDTSILANNDKTSPATEPSSPSIIKYNTIGGNSWAKTGQWIEWEIDVPEDGNYQIGFRWRQSTKMGGVSTRMLSIDGSVPFEEASRIAFDYDSSWRTGFIGEDKPWTFFLKKGKHTLRLTAGLGDMSDTLRSTDEIIEKLNDIYMKIIMVSGTSPDLKRDYDFKTQIPEVIEQYNEVAKEIQQIIDDANDKTGGTQSTTELQQVLDILTEMYKDPETTAKRLSDFQSSITTLATWLTDSCDQPLELDYIFITSRDTELPKAGKGVLSNIVFSVEQLIASYTVDYTNIGNTTEHSDNDESLTVWIIAGTEQAQVTQQLINEQFITETNIPVKLQNVTTAAIMPAVLVGQGPDVVINLTEAEPINYALRGVVKNLNEYEDVETVLEQFEESTYEAFKLENGLYALPTSVDFPVLFYRKDVLEELDISLEDCETWDTTLQVVLPKLQIKNLKFGINPILASYITFYYQTGNELYSDDKLNILFDTQNASNSFKNFTSIYTDYKQSISFNFANLFRSGEMPVAVMPYSSYYQLAEFAPEIMDKCGVTVVPGIKDEHGNVNHTTTTTVTGASIFNDTDMPDKAWTFLKWWVCDDTQSVYAEKVETILGIAGRVSVVSDKARESIAWSDEILNSLSRQLKMSKGVPQVPGSYYVSRYFDFAFRDVVYDGKDIVQTLISITEDINTEIKEKTEELHGNYK